LRQTPAQIKQQLKQEVGTMANRFGALLIFFVFQKTPSSNFMVQMLWYEVEDSDTKYCYTASGFGSPA
jgi:hypothetical protein